MFQFFLPPANAGSLGPGRSLAIVDRAGVRSEPWELDAALLCDLRTLARFLDLYCRCRHPAAGKETVTISGFDVNAIARKDVSLCADCARLLTHAFVKRSRCPMDPKPACKRCVKHCYHPAYREKIREVMRFSGTRLLLTGRLDYLFHFLL